MAGQATTRDAGSILLGKFQIRVGNSAAHIQNTGVALTDSDSVGSVEATSFSRATEIFEHTSGFPAVVDTTIPTAESASMNVTMEEVNPRNLAIAAGLDPSVAGETWEARILSSITASGTTDPAKVIAGDADAESDIYRVIFTGATTYEVYSDKRGVLTGTGSTTALSAFTLGALALLTIPADFFTGTWADNEILVVEMQKEGYADTLNGGVNLGSLKAPDYVRVEAVIPYPNKAKTLVVIFPRAQITTNGDFAPTNDAAANVPVTITASLASAIVVGGDAAWDNAPLGKQFTVAGLV